MYGLLKDENAEQASQDFITKSAFAEMDQVLNLKISSRPVSLKKSFLSKWTVTFSINKKDQLRFDICNFKDTMEFSICNFLIFLYSR